MAGARSLLLAVAISAVPSFGADLVAERDLRPGESHRERIPMDAGEFVHVVVDQLGIDVALAVLDSSGKRLAQMDTPTGDRGPEEISWIAATGGDYFIEISSSDSEGLPGSYRIRVDRPRPAGAGDRIRVRAESLAAEGHQLAAQSDVESLKRGLAKLLAALPLWRQLHDPRGEAITLFGLGRTCQSLREGENALQHYSAALSLWKELGDRNEEASTLFGLASVETGAGKTSEALAHYREALTLERRIGNRAMEAEVLTSLGALHNVLGEKREALEHYTLALPLMRSTRNRTGELRTLNSIGYLYDFQGEKQTALDAYRQALAISRELKRKSGEAMVLGNLGRLYADLGEEEQATAHLKDALEIRKSLGDRGAEATVLLYMGQVLADRGDHERAIAIYLQALPLLKLVENRSKEAAALNSLGEAYLAVREIPNAFRRFEEALAIARGAEDRYLEGAAMTNLGVSRGALGQKEEAVKKLEQALEVRRSIGDRAGEAATIFELARLERARGDLTTAHRHAEAALKLLEAERAAVSSRELRASYLATVRAPYEFAIDLLMELHRRDPSADFAARALETAERARARSFLELLDESRIDVREGVEPTLLERERSVRDLLRGKLERQLRLAGEKGEGAQAARVAREILALTAEHEQIETQIRSASPRYAALTQPRPLTAAEIQRDVLDDRTALLEYALGEERSFLWVMTPNDLRGYELPGRTEIESAARRFYESLEGFQRGTKQRNGSARRTPIAEAETLSRILLAPAVKELADKRLVIVGEGALQYVPFAALPDPAATPPVPLVVNHEIVNLPSASILGVVRRDTAGRRLARKQLAVFADPVFDKQDQRLRGVADRTPGASEVSTDRKAAEESQPALVRSARDLGLAGLPRLLYTRREARAILDLVPETDRFEATDFAANRASVIHPRLADYRYVHFATHGFFNSLNPELSGIVLSLVDEAGRPQDGFLTARDVFSLKLPAEVVVLSACRTALGKDIRGEGLVGITRGFMYAGAPRVVASLWTVDDVATAELMKRFYRGMLGESRLPAAAALRAAQIALWKTRRWSAPYYWGAFVLQGEWN